VTWTTPRTLDPDAASVTPGRPGLGLAAGPAPCNRCHPPRSPSHCPWGRCPGPV